ncbi:S8 family serine peptidase [Sunxiuqinia sp. A32]|uniref:S8 family serine peptidase n=1 Tax=Sunxiuqinia sp. A32 TaxID=3461496 RepID=UPI0040464485
MKIWYLFVILMLSSFFSSQAKDDTSNYYWIGFNDKKGTAYSVNRPNEFLSARAIQRRLNQYIPIDELDLPVSKNYIDSLESKGAKIINYSKWLNGVTILASETQYESILSGFNFIRESELTKPGLTLKSSSNKFWNEKIHTEIDSSYYGYSSYQVGQLNGHFLHENDFLGQGIQIAVLDAGFYKVNELPAFDVLNAENRILGTRDFVDPFSDVYLRDNHGMNVLSTMASELPGYLIGTAPKASYYLLRSEDASSEYLIEEDNWVAAAEYADSLGVDIINSSLGYSEFDDSTMNHSYSDMDGMTTRVSRAANIAFQKGMLVIASAGNEANDPWHYIISPADANQVIAVGAVDQYNQWALFSSIGPNSDNEIKPNVAAMGLNSVVQKSDGKLGVANGTSFSSPILAGMAACLWQALPGATNKQIKNAIEESASQYSFPDTLLGYGIPNFELANALLTNKLGDQSPNKQWAIGPNPFESELRFFKRGDTTLSGKYYVSIVQSNGQVVFQKVFQEEQLLYFGNLSNLPDGIYVVYIESNGNREYHKVVKLTTK